MCEKYSKNAIFTMLHRERQCCSNDGLFHESLKELKEVLKRNGYSLKLIESKIQIFLNDPQKHVWRERVHTLCLDYNSSLIEGYVDSLMKRLRRVLPNFWVNIAYKTKTVYNLFSSSA